MSADGPGDESRDPQHQPPWSAERAGVIEELEVPGAPAEKTTPRVADRVVVVAAAVILLGGLAIALIERPGDSPVDTAQATPTLTVGPSLSPPSLPIGARLTMSHPLDTHPFTFAVPAEGWMPNQYSPEALTKGVKGDRPLLFMASGFKVNYDGQPCANPPIDQPPADWSLADIATGIGRNPDIEGFYVLDDGVAGYPAKELGFIVRADACDEPNVWSGAYSRHQIRVWLIDVDGDIVWITGVFPWPPVTQPAIDEAGRIIHSVRFEAPDHTMIRLN